MEKWWEYLDCKGAKPGRGRSAFVKVPCFLSKYDPDPLRQPVPLFKKLDESVVEEEYAQSGGRERDRETGDQRAGVCAPALLCESDVRVRVLDSSPLWQCGRALLWADWSV